MNTKTEKALINKMTMNQRLVYRYLKKNIGKYFGPQHIGDAALGTDGVSARASDACRRLVKLGLATRMRGGKYSALPVKRPKRPMSPLQSRLRIAEKKVRWYESKLSCWINAMGDAYSQWFTKSHISSVLKQGKAIGRKRK